MDTLTDDLNHEPLLEEEESVVFNTPQLPSQVYENLPRILTETTDLFPDGLEKDIFFLSALTVLSCCLPNLEGMYFNHSLSPHLYLFIAAPAASGKGTMTWSRDLAQAIEERMIKETDAARAAYEQELNQYEALPREQRLGRPRPVEPPRKAFFIPANSSTSSLIQQLSENGFKGLIFETEADTLSNTSKQDWGDSSDLLRKAFHHENTSLARRKDREFIRITDPHLGICLSGTPKQVHNLIPDVENGLFSRFMFYAFEDNRGFLNPYVSYQPVDYELFFKQKSEEVYQLYDRLQNQSNPVVFQVTPDQGERFTEFFQSMLEKDKSLLLRDMEASTKRLGVIFFRIAMTLSGLRLMETGEEIPPTIICSEQDFQTAITITSILETHALAVYRQMPRVNLKGKRLLFFESLPLRFDRKGYLAVAKRIGIEDRTADKYVGLFKLQLLDHDDYNHYSKKV